MTKTELFELIASGEGLTIEFKSDKVHKTSLAKEMSALLNTSGGVILLGVEDDGSISGISRGYKEAEAWVMNLARHNIQPSFTPAFSSIKISDDCSVGVVHLRENSPSKPYRAKKNNAWVTYVRAGSTSVEASRDEETRLFQSAGLIKYESRHVEGVGLQGLSLARIENYFKFILQISTPSRTETDEWKQILLNSNFLVEIEDGAVCASVAGLLLFGENPNLKLYQAGVTASAFPGIEKGYNITEQELIRGPLVPLYSADDSTLESGVIDRAADFINRNMNSVAWLEGTRRRVRKAYPPDAVREAIVNAVIHRDYAREGTDIEMSLYSDRLEIISPGGLPNGVTVEKMKQGVVRVTRNGLIKDTLQNCGYVEHLGMGVRNRIIKSMKEHNGTEPELIDADDRFTVRFWKSPAQ